MRLFLICLSLLYVVGVSYAQRLKVGAPSCTSVASALPFGGDQASAMSQHLNQPTNGADASKGHFLPANGMTMIGGEPEGGTARTAQVGLGSCPE